MKPLRNNLCVKIDESLPNHAGIYLAPNTQKWRVADDQLGNRGRVIQVGAGKRHPKTGVLMSPQCKEGDIVRFSELEYPSIDVNGERLLIVNEKDIVGIEA
jgi:co-chaperonin GroES (HSP10)